MPETATAPPPPVLDAAQAAAEADCLAEVRFELELIRGFSEVAGDLAETIARAAFTAGADWERRQIAPALTDTTPSPEPRAPSPEPPAPSPQP